MKNTTLNTICLILVLISFVFWMRALYHNDMEGMWMWLAFMWMGNYGALLFSRNEKDNS